MANTYTQLYVHLVFAVKERAPLVGKDRREELHKYITGIITNKDCKVLAIGSMPDHIHIFLGLHPKFPSPILFAILNRIHQHLLRKKGWSPIFAWQDGYGAFTYSRSQKADVIRYVLNQEEHHKERTFREEYLEFLKVFDIEYDERYIFHEAE